MNDFVPFCAVSPENILLYRRVGASTVRDPVYLISLVAMKPMDS